MTDCDSPHCRRRAGGIAQIVFGSVTGRGASARYPSTAFAAESSPLEIDALPRPHLFVQHLLKYLEFQAAERADTDARPPWLTELIERAADQFAPYAGVGRVGFECEPAADGWEARLYLGSTEVVGGPEDGQWRQASFELNLAGLTACFTQVDELRWNVAASGADCSSSFLTVRGRVGEHAVCVKAYSRAPARLGPGLREYQDGSIVPVA